MATPKHNQMIPGQCCSVPTDTHVDGLDPASKALSEALRISFRVLSIIMLLLIVAFLLSGVFQVTTDEKAVVLRFGQIVDGDKSADQAVRGPGIHLSWPYPVDRIVRVPTHYRDLQINSAWYFENPADATRTSSEINPRSAGLQPGYDGSLMTGDRGLIHVKWICKYRVPADNNEAVLNYITHVTDPEEALRTAIDNASIKVAGTMNVELIWVNKDNEFVTAVIQEAQRTLNELKTGIEISSLTIDGNKPPLQALAAFNAVISAQQEADKLRTEAHRSSSERLLETAGASWPALRNAIDAYDKALRDEDARQAEAAFQQISDLMMAESTTGRAKEIVYQAQSYSAALVQKAAQDEDRFHRLLPAYRSNPEFTIRRLWDETQQVILSSQTIEKTHVPQGLKYVLQLGQDPKVTEQMQRLEAEKARQKLEEERRRERGW